MATLGYIIVAVIAIFFICIAFGVNPFRKNK